MENNTMTPTSTGTSSASSGLKGRATQGARNLLEETESQARARLDAGRKDAADTLASLASTLLSSSGHLKDEQQDLAGEYVGKAAEQIDRLAQYIQSADPAEVVDGVKEFARRRPALFIGSAFAVGVIAARFLKSSQRRSDASTPMSDREVPTPRSVESGTLGDQQ